MKTSSLASALPSADYLVISQLTAVSLQLTFELCLKLPAWKTEPVDPVESNPNLDESKSFDVWWMPECGVMGAELFPR